MNPKISMEQAGPLFLVFLESSNDPGAPIAIAAADSPQAALEAAIIFLGDGMRGVLDLAADMEAPAAAAPKPILDLLDKPE